MIHAPVADASSTPMKSESIDSSALQQSAGAAPSADNTGAGQPSVHQMSVRQYLDTTVVPLLLQGMSELVQQRPSDPIEWLAQYLLQNKGKAPYPGDGQQQQQQAPQQ